MDAGGLAVNYPQPPLPELLDGGLGQVLLPKRVPLHRGRELEVGREDEGNC